ncbi:MAG: protein kinase, partial [Chloroflexaceae bacterium]|nr:protein kinase [Chloroflexaceae bacterium]
MSTPARMRAQQASGKANGEAPRELRNYRLGERVGQEELATVYQAVHQTLDRPVQVHILRRTDWVSASRFQLAARLAARLSHPNLLPVIDAGHDDRYGDYIITPLLEARSLADMLAEGPLDAITSLKIATQLAAALDYLHNQGIIHRDVQPSSVQVTPQNLAYLTNLTLAASSDTPDLSSLAEAD